MNLQIVEGNSFDKTVLVKPGFRVPFEFGNILVQPDRVAQIKLVADILQSLKYFPGPVQLPVIIFDYRIL